MKKIYLLVAIASAVFQINAAEILVECESFSEKGGWCVDAQFVCSMGSPYLLAHGMGVPVADAVTTNAFPSTREWRVWVRTRDWTPDFEGVKPGRFQLVLEGEILPSELGVTPEDWGWVDAGLFTNTGAEVEIRLHDLTGFDGRCDAIYFTDDINASAPPADESALALWRVAQKGEDTVPALTEGYDFVVVGGGIAGTCAALAAAEKDLRVVLIQDRPVLGGNASSEIRVRTEGEKRHRIVEAVANNAVNGSSGSIAYDAQRMLEVTNQPNITCNTGWRAYNIEMSSTGTIDAVYARNVQSGVRKRFSGRFFADCTGDGWLAFWGGAEYAMGREARVTYDESRAPETADAMTMGNTLMWNTYDTGAPVPFPEVPWATNVAGTAAATSGGWNWEYGMHLNTIYDAEEIRDHLLRAIYGNFYNAKQSASNDNRAFAWVPYVTGKRESRRIVGDYLLTQQDIVDGRWFEDAVGSATWSIDLHYPTSVSYRSTYIPTHVSRWFFPYRSLYCRDIPNLFMAGRNISVSHVALGSPRVMNTCGQMGVAIGYAAWLCDKYSCTPRDIYRSEARTEELQLIIGGTWPIRVYVEPEDSDADVIVDNTNSANVELSGIWSESTSMTGQFFGSNYLHDGNTGKGVDKWVRFTPDLPDDGTYEVFAIWSESPGRATSVPIEIVSSEGTNTVTVNMQANGGVWNSLGMYTFEAGQNGSVKIGTAGTDNYVIADAVRWKAQGSVVDNSDYDRVTISGDWLESTYHADRYAENYLHNNHVTGDDMWVRYTPNITTSRLYTVRMYWCADSSRDSAVPVEIVHADGTNVVSVDMTASGGQWNAVGTYNFAEGTSGSVRICSTNTTGYIIADAVWFEPYGDPVDDSDWDRNGLTDSWERWYFLNAGGVDPDDDPDGDGLTNMGEFIAGCDPTDEESFFSIKQLLCGDSSSQPGSSDIQLNWPSAEGRTYTIKWSSSVAGPYTELTNNIPATPPMNSHGIESDLPRGFFKVIVE